MEAVGATGIRGVSWEATGSGDGVAETNAGNEILAELVDWNTTIN